MNPEISIIVCVYNEEENIHPLIHQIKTALVDFSYEVIYVDDGSTDGTLRQLKSANCDQLTTIELRKNFGQSSALAAGIDHARGKYIVTMDGDLQNDPADIPAMLDKLKSNDLDLVVGIRSNRKDGILFRKIPSRIANYFIRNLSGVKMKDYGCTLKVFRSNIAKNMGLYGELHRFIPVLVSFDGARIQQMNVRHHARQFGVSKYGLGRTFKVISDLILMLFMKKFLQRPMHLFGNLGVLTFLSGAIISIYLLILKIMGQDIWGRPLLMLSVMLIIAGIQLITIGLVMEMQMRTYYESQQKRPYSIRQIIEQEKGVHN